MKKVLNVILGLAFIAIIVSGWVFGISAYRKVSKLEERQQEEMEKLKIQLDDVFQEVGDYIEELETRIAELEETIPSSDYEKLQRYLTIYEPVLEAQHDLAAGAITLEEYNERMHHLANQWEEIKNLYDSDVYDYIPSLVERLEELEDIVNAFDDLEDAIEKALNATDARLNALEELK
jgi:chromosome segregation ATPase